MRLSLRAALIAVFLSGLIPSPANASDDIGDEGFLSSPLGTAEPRDLSPDDIGLLSRIESYLNRFTTVKARFVQLSSEGGFAEGTVYVERPGKMRFEYDPPTPVLLIADGNKLLYYDKELESATFVPLDETPLWFLMRPEVNFDDRVAITDIDEELGTVAITVQSEERTAAGEVTLIFTDRPITLRKWVVTDAQGISIQVSLLDPQFDLALEDSLFKYDDLDVFGTERGPSR